MAAINTVPVAEIQTENRFDAEFYHPKYEDIEDVFHRLNDCEKLDVLCNSIKKGIFDINPSSYTFSGIPLIRTSQIKSLISGDDGLVFISETGHIKHYIKTELFYGDIVFTKIGAGIGDVAILSNTFKRYNFSQNVAGLTIKRDKIDPYYLIAFLGGKYGRKQIIRYMMPSGQGKLELRDIKKIKIPRLGHEETKIAAMIIEAERLLHSSKKKYAAAQQLLESELGLDKLRFDKPVGYTARFSDLGLSLRSDAQHFQPRFVQLLDHLAKFSNKRIRDIRRCNRRGIQPVYVKNGTCPVVNSQHLGSKHINYEGLEKTTVHVFNASPEAHIQPDDLLIYTTGAYIGRTNAYLDRTPAFASNHVNILRLSPDIDHAYMSMVFQSIVGQFQTQKHSRGSAQAELYPTDIDKFVVPLLPSNKQKEIGDLVRESLTKQRESAQLLNQAKSSVEELIEEAVRA